MTGAPLDRTELDALIAAGTAHLRARRVVEARTAFVAATRIDPGSAAAWRGLGNALHAAGNRDQGGKAHMRALQASASDPELVRAAEAVGARRLAEAYPILRDRLQAEPNDLAALRIMADLAAMTGHYIDAFRMLARAVELAPDFAAIRTSLRDTLYLAPRDEALAAVDEQLARQPGHIGYRNLKAALLERAGDHDGAIAVYRAILDERPAEAGVWMTLGHILKTIGRTAECISAYRRSVALAPANGGAWWSLANIKTFRFEPADFETIAKVLARPDLAKEARFHLEFALGKAFEDSCDYARSYAHYAEGNRLRRETISYDPADLADQRRRAARLFTPAFLAARTGSGSPVPDPIFVVGLPRSGSTLVEQILASHPAIEGTTELDDLHRIVRTIDATPPGNLYPEAIAGLDGPQLAALGEDYLRTTRAWRKADRPRFIDKLPANFAHVGLIRLILPNARIIDVRRHPLSTGFSCFKQHFARGHNFSYDQAEIGTHYAEYVRFMVLWDRLLPGHVHRVFYEKLIADIETEVRRMLDYLGLEFDPACLNFHETRRAIHTPSAEQVRQPIFTDALDQWRRYEPWLDPLKVALGDVLEFYPESPPE